MDVQTAVWGTPLPLLLLCVRENQRQYNKDGITLHDKEMIDNFDEELRRQNYGK